MLISYYNENKPTRGRLQIFCDGIYVTSGWIVAKMESDHQTLCKGIKYSGGSLRLQPKRDA